MHIPKLSIYVHVRHENVPRYKQLLCVIMYCISLFVWPSSYTEAGGTVVDAVPVVLLLMTLFMFCFTWFPWCCLRLDAIPLYNVNLALQLYESCVQSVILYGSQVWYPYLSQKCLNNMDKIFYQFIKMLFNLKTNIPNIYLVGETGHMPPSVMAKIPW